MIISEEKFNEVYSNTNKLLYQIIYSYVRNKDDSLDILQDVYFKYLEKKPNINNLDEIKFWLIRVAINKSINYLRYKKLHNVIYSDEIINSYQNKNNKNELEYIYELICTMDSKYKDVLILYYYESMTTAQIAKALKKKDSTIRMRLLKAREILKEKVEKYNDGNKN